MGAAQEVAEAQRVVEERKIESVQTAAAAAAEVQRKQLEGSKRVIEATHTAERSVETATGK